MTFYWWSHWFWITFLATLIFHHVQVYTYPSQEIHSEYNNQDVRLMKPVTKLYQATTITFAWTANTIPPSTIMPPVPTMVKTKLQKITPPSSTWPTITTGSDEYESIVNSSNEFEFKRSAEIANKTNGRSQQSPEESKSSDVGTLDNPITNNYTNFSSNAMVNESSALFNQNWTTVIPKEVSLLGSVTPTTPNIENTNSSEIPAQFSQDDSTDSLNGIASHKVPFTLENVNKEDELRRAETEHRTRKSKVLSAEYRHRVINYSTDSKNLLARSASTAPNDFESGESNISSEALSIQRTYFLDAGAISAICLIIFGICCTVATVGVVLYRRRYLNKPQTLSEPDSSVYIDDSTLRVSDNSDEMYSLDNDSFLNSLEAMTIQNYWTDTVKHTKL